MSDGTDTTEPRHRCPWILTTDAQHKASYCSRVRGWIADRNNKVITYC